MSSNTAINLEQVVRDWAWRRFERRAGRKEKKLLTKERRATDSACAGAYIGLRIDWSEVQFVDSTKWLRLSEGEPQENGAAAGSNGEVITEVAGQSVPQVSVLFQTKFTNNTKAAQEYTMKTEKTTKSTCSTEIESCFTRGFEMSVTLKSPCEIFEANAGYKQEMSLTNMHGETFEEELHWGVESLIKVDAQHEAEASLVVNEKKQSGDFVIESKIWGMVYVHFTNTRDNNSLLMATGHTIADIIEEYLEKQNRKGKPMNFVEVKAEKEGEESKIYIKTRGRSKFRYGVRQEIKVNQIALAKK